MVSEEFIPLQNYSKLVPKICFLTFLFQNWPLKLFITVLHCLLTLSTKNRHLSKWLHRGGCHNGRHYETISVDDPITLGQLNTHVKFWVNALHKSLNGHKIVIFRDNEVPRPKHGKKFSAHAFKTILGNDKHQFHEYI